MASPSTPASTCTSSRRWGVISNSDYKDLKTGLFDKLEKALIAQVKKYEPDLEVSDVDVVGDAPAFPYVEYDQFEEPITQTFEAMDNDPVKIAVQMKAVSDNKNQAKAIAYWLSKLYAEQQPSYELLQQNIVLKKARMILPTRDDMTSGFIFTSGVALHFEVLDDWQDTTQPGQFDSVDFSIKKSKEES